MYKNIRKDIDEEEKIDNNNQMPNKQVANNL